jgi:hypothetical protein
LTVSSAISRCALLCSFPLHHPLPYPTKQTLQTGSFSIHTTEHLPIRHRPDRPARTDIHDIPLSRTPLHHLHCLPLPRVTLRSVLHQRILRSRHRPAPVDPTRLEHAFLAAIDYRLSCTREALQLYYVNLVALSGPRFYILSSSSSAAVPTPTSSSTITTAHVTNPIGPSSLSPPGHSREQPRHLTR